MAAAVNRELPIRLVRAPLDPGGRARFHWSFGVSPRGRHRRFPGAVAAEGRACGGQFWGSLPINVTRPSVPGPTANDAQDAALGMAAVPRNGRAVRAPGVYRPAEPLERYPVQGLARGR